MKRTLYIIAIALAAIISAQAKDASQLRVYVNPGHGSWTANDRPFTVIREDNGMLTVVSPNTDSNTPDTTAFYESNTDLQKCFAIVDKLESYGLVIDRTKNQTNSDMYKRGAARDLSNNIFMSRVLNGPYPRNAAATTVCNRDLAEIAYEAHTNNFDVFVSVHSNGNNDGSATSENYPLILYRGTDTEDYAPGSKAIANAIWPYLVALPHQKWSSSSTRIRGDINFYTKDGVTGVTILGTTGCKGYLGVLKHAVPGILIEGYFHTYTPSRQRAMNWDVDRMEGYAYARGLADYLGLTKESTGDIYGVVRDAEETFSHTYYKPNSSTNDKYKPINGATVKLYKDGQLVGTYTTDNYYNGAFVFADLEVGTYTVELTRSGYLKKTAEVEVTAAHTTPVEMFMNQSSGYEDPMLGEEDVELQDEYPVTDVQANQQITQLQGLNVRRVIPYEGNLYILAFDSNDQPTIVVYNSKTAEVVRTVSTTGTSGTYMPVADIAMTSDGYLVALNGAQQASAGSAQVKGYYWGKDAAGLPTGSPQSFFSLAHAGNWYFGDFGKSMCYSGTLSNGRMVFMSKSNGSESNRIEIVTISNGSATSIHNNLNDTSDIFNDNSIGDIQLQAFPDYKNNKVLLTSENQLPMEIQLSNTSAGVPAIVNTLPAGKITGNGFRSTYMMLNGRVVMVVPPVAGGTVWPQLLDVTDGIQNAQPISMSYQTQNSRRRTNAWTQADAGTPAIAALVDGEYADGGELRNYTMRVHILHGDGLMTTLASTTVVREPCATPEINIDANNNVIVTCDTPGAVLHTNVVADDHKLTHHSSGDEVNLSGIYTITSYASAEKHDDSEPVTATLIWAKPSSPMTGEGIVHAGTERVVIICSVGDHIVVKGTGYNEAVYLYTIDGTELFSGPATEGQFTIPVTLTKGTAYIITVGNRTAKHLH